MFPLFLCVFLLFSCLSCQKPPELLESREPVKVTEIQADRLDGEILHIAEDARNTLPDFFRSLTKSGRAGAEYFCVKYPLLADEDSGINMEQVWLTGIHFKNGLHYGILANTPRYLSGMKKGDKIIFEMDSVTDWMYIRGGKIIGGDSIKYLLEKTPEYQRGERERELLRMFN